jgi:hypothetical protein
MVLSLGRILSLLQSPKATRAYPVIDLGGLSDHDLADLNLPAEVRLRAELKRVDVASLSRW